MTASGKSKDPAGAQEQAVRGANGQAHVDEQAGPGPGSAGLAAVGGDEALAQALFGDPTKLTEPIKTVQDKFALLPAFLKVRLPSRAAGDVV
jgi:hypothetical protein